MTAANSSEISSRRTVTASAADSLVA
jgi:hypothetical protein